MAAAPAPRALRAPCADASTHVDWDGGGGGVGGDGLSSVSPEELLLGELWRVPEGQTEMLGSTASQTILSTSDSWADLTLKQVRW
eukprot:364179-Chlamydomonas_euryale.AAC.1